MSSITAPCSWKRGRQRPRCRFRHALGLRLGAGSVRNLAGSGWADIAQSISADIAAGKTMSDVPLPAWVLEAGRIGVHTADGSWSARDKSYAPRSSLPIYQRQLFPERVLGEGGATPEKSGETLYENDGVRLWKLPALDAGIGILSIKSKMHTIGNEVLDGVIAAVRQAEATLDGVVVWHEAPFAVGANLQQVGEACAAGQFDILEATVEKFQRASQTLKYAQVPVVAAVQGMALGAVVANSSCMPASASWRSKATSASLKAGVGLIPAGGGCKEFRRARR